MPDSLRIALLSSRDLVRHGVQGMLGRLPIRAHVTDHLDPSRPADVIIVDATGTTDESAESMELVTDDETAPVVLLTSREAPEGFGVWDRPVHAFVTVSATDAEMVAAVASALRTSVVTRAARAIEPFRRSSYGLTEREAQVLAAIAGGRSNDQIAAELFLGVNTIKTYIRSAYAKIGVGTRPNAILWALGHGLGPAGVGRVEDDEDVRWEDGDDPASPPASP
jgi:two-component system, NarL family, response regulator LiaR